MEVRLGVCRRTAGMSSSKGMQWCKPVTEDKASSRPTRGPGYRLTCPWLLSLPKHMQKVDAGNEYASVQLEGLAPQQRRSAVGV